MRRKVTREEEEVKEGRGFGAWTRLWMTSSADKDVTQ